MAADPGARSDGGPEDARPGLKDWLFTFPFLLAFGGTLLVYDPLQRLARLFGRRPHELVVGALEATLVGAFHICGTRIAVERSPQARPDTGYLLIANHQSMFDVPIIGAVLFTNYPKYVSKRELARWIPSISYNLRRGGNALIDRGDRKQAQEAIARLGREAQERNVSVVIYPEGTRSRRGTLGPFKPGGTLALLEAAPDLPVVPVAIDESWRLLRHNLLPVPFGVRVRLHVGAPLPRAPGDGKALLEQARREIEAALARWRSE